MRKYFFMLKIKSTEILKIAAIAIPLLAIIIVSGCISSSVENARQRVKFNSDWKFAKGDIQNGQLTEFNDEDWRTLDLTHDWAIEGPFTQDVGYKGGYLPYPGIGWYRKSFRVSSDTKNLMIEFDGIMRNSQIWLNGKYIGGWPYGYTSFAIDISDKIDRENENLIAVRVENQDSSSRWYPGSGIYRNVWLTYTNAVHVDHWGTQITTPEISKESARVNMNTIVVNSGSSPVSLTLETSIVDKGGKTIQIAEGKAIKLEGGEKREIPQEMTIQNPSFWDINNPYLYEAQTKVLVNKKIVDSYVTPFGVRYFHFDPDKGFFLNGRHLKLYGVNLHHDLGPLGAAVNKRAIQRQLEIMKEMGVNAIRCAHNPPTPEQLDLCDEMGILVIDETFDTWNEAKYAVQNDYSIWFDEWAVKDTEALIKRDRNHPSVILWSIGNEVMNLHTEIGKKNAQMQVDICKRLDPTRPVMAGVHCTTIWDEELANIFDVFGMNYWQDMYDSIHAQFPNSPLFASESSASLSTRGAYMFPVKETYRGYNHPSKQITSYDIVNTGFGTLPDVEFELQKAPWMAGQFVWSGFDYHGEPDPYEDGYFPAHSSYFGIVDMCGFKKDRFYLYQSQWTTEPMIHVLPHWNWEGREGETTPVYVYSNCAAVELIVNGKSQGKKEYQEGTYRYIWDEIKYQPGSIKAIGYDKGGNILCEKEIKTAGTPSKITLIADRDMISADGEDLSFITVKITDKDGNICPTAADLVQFEIEGEGSLASVGNGDPTCTESYQKNERSAFNGLCLLMVKSSAKEGTIKISAVADNLEKSSIEIKTISPEPERMLAIFK
jgi:beta-galactosidase